ncbi:hypothetical protein [Winogradskya consettensis]|nr:hypothetical protein [Actinoplanes consettensis]
MSRISSGLSGSWSGPALIALMGLAAFAGARLGRRATTKAIAQIRIPAVDYWSVYEHVQRDMLGDDDGR